MQKILRAMAIAAACSVSLAAQWPKQEATGVPRDAQGKARLDAPPPRAADGKPDLSGVWRRTDRDPPPAVLAGCRTAGLPKCRAIGNASSEELKQIMAACGIRRRGDARKREDVLCFVNWH